MPTIPDAASVIRKRYRMRRTLRFASLVLVMVFLVGTLVGLIGDMRYGCDWGDLAWYALSASGFLVGALFLGVFEAHLVRWVVPMPRPGCPLCGHSSLPERGQRCSECGAELPAELLSPPPPGPRPDQPAAPPAAPQRPG